MKPVEKGFSLVEVIIVVALFGVVGSSLSVASIGGLYLVESANDVYAATRYASEGIEVARSIRDRSFDDLVLTDSTGVVRNDGRWEFAESSDIFGKFERRLRIESIGRDGDGDIVSEGGADDPDTRRVVSTVYWDTYAGRETSVELTTYLADWEAVMLP